MQGCPAGGQSDRSSLVIYDITLPRIVNAGSVDIISALLLNKRQTYSVVLNDENDKILPIFIRASKMCSHCTGHVYSY